MQYVSKMRLNQLYLLFFSILPPFICAYSEEPLYKELWIGEFQQISPMPWTGKFELFMRYSVKSKIVPFEGIITWSDIGNTRTKVKGSMSERKIEFTEEKCLSGECSKLFLGGKYLGTIDEKYSTIEGISSLKLIKENPIEFSGKFRLNRIESKSGD